MSKVDELLAKEMTRRQFLVTVGFGIFSLLGLSAMMGALTGETSTKSSTGYGASNYGH